MKRDTCARGNALSMDRFRRFPSSVAGVLSGDRYLIRAGTSPVRKMGDSWAYLMIRIAGHKDASLPETFQKYGGILRTNRCPFATHRAVHARPRGT